MTFLQEMAFLPVVGVIKTLHYIEHAAKELSEEPTNTVQETFGNSVCFKTMHIRPHCISLPWCILVAVCVYVCYEDSITQQQKGTLSLHYQCNILSIELFTFSF